MKVGIIGAGTMGSGIAQAFAQAGNEVCLCDIKAEWAEGGKAKIAKGLAGRVAKGKMEQADADAITARITTGTNEIVKDCDLVVEAALEKICLLYTSAICPAAPPTILRARWSCRKK